MAYVNNTTALRKGSPVSGLGGIIAALRLQLQRREVYTRTVRELQALSERDLADLGIHRSMIEKIAHEAAYGN
jgi:uncharacterized protein YjiS (DUF1127 family)